MRLSLILLSLLSLLAACTPDPGSGPRIDFVGNSRFVSNNRLVTAPGDTLSTRIFADNRDSANGPLLQRLLITVKYEPQSSPFIYASPYDPELAPKDSVVYLDSLLTVPKLAYQLTFGTRTTSGRETWRFEVTDADGNKASRRFWLTTRKTDSLTVTYHEYIARLQAPTSQRTMSFLDLDAGLLFPNTAVRTNPVVQQRIDVLYFPSSGNAPILVTPAEPLFTANGILGIRAWPAKNQTILKQTQLLPTAFAGATNPQALTTAFDNAQNTTVTRTGALALNQVFAFRTTGGQTGLILVEKLPTSDRPTVDLRVRVTKQQP
ncbi:hypothetical protein H8B13_16290 [Hymenobacter sp. BT188]|uniref:hypothetical protein n=1 Tax=Hymenobacter sp. BT188 TaxID=2763504 RepID=UPI001650F73F|nr:hypothetical protein [Hymenobacter sp. BT188]MBC6608387.1 hypothetical protein [Hymenobacter sp. BT188]